MFLQEALSLDPEHPFGSCETSGRQVLLSGLHFVSNELTRIEAAAHEEQCRWDAIIGTMTLSSQLAAISDDSNLSDAAAVTMPLTDQKDSASAPMSQRHTQGSTPTRSSPKQSGDAESPVTPGSQGKGKAHKKCNKKNKK